MFLEPKVDHLPSTHESRQHTRISEYLPYQPPQKNISKAYHPTPTYEHGKYKTNLQMNRYQQIQSKHPDSTAHPSKYNNPAQEIELLLHSITSQLENASSKNKQTPEIKVNFLMLHRIDKIRHFLPQLKEMIGQKGGSNRCTTQNGDVNCSSSEAKKWTERQRQIKKQLQRMVELTVQRPCNSSTIHQLLNHLGSVVSSYLLDKNEQHRLQAENKKIRLHYINEIEICREELKFIHEVIQEKESLIDSLERQIFEWRKNREQIVSFYDEQETFALESMQQQLQKGQMKRSGSLNIIDNSYDIEKEPEPIKALQPDRNEDSPRKISSHTILVNPQSHQKSKSDLHVPRLTKQDQVIVYTEFGSPNEKGKEMDPLIYQKLRESEEELAAKSERLAALDEEIGLLQQNLSFLNSRISVQEDDFSQRERSLQDLESKIKIKQEEMQLLQQKIQALTQEQEIEEYNIDKAQEQLYFLEEQCQLAVEELQNHKNKLVDYSGKGEDKENQNANAAIC